MALPSDSAYGSDAPIHPVSGELGEADELDSGTRGRAAVQAYLDRAYEELAGMERRTGAAEQDAAERAAGDWDATMAQRHLARRLASLRDDSSPLCFGSIDETGGTRWHIGRRHVEDGVGEPVVIDWRAPAAVPFYRATYADPFGLDRRRRFLLEGRRLLDLLEEDFANPDAPGSVSTGGLPDPLLATLGHARRGTMRDIVATIAAEQDRIIRAPLDRPVIVQGGPGTGKTAVGLHRAAFLLYEHRRSLERHRVLVLGPNRLFLTYISEVLPSLGEVAVTQTTLEGLVPAWVVRGDDPPEVAALKGDARMAEVLHAACDALVGTPAGDLTAATRWGSVTVAAADLADLLERAVASGGPFADRRARFRRSVSEAVGRRLDARRGRVVDRAQITTDLNADRSVAAALDRMWPSSSPAALVRRLLSRAGAAGLGPMEAQELALLARPAARTRREEAWTPADLPLLDEAAALLGGSPRVYGHVVVDEAQDLSPMALRMVRRRSRDGRSFTVLGDLAQATAPGATADWGRAIAALGDPDGAVVEALSVGYRVPAPIMDAANAYLANCAPHLEPTGSVRLGGDPPAVVHADTLSDAVMEQTTHLLAELQTVAAISSAPMLHALAAELADRGLPADPPGMAARPGHLALVQAEDAKGLEFDAVLVVEPAAIVALPGGPGLLYIAMTRAVQRLTVLHRLPLPPGFPALG